jgi:hypothetical protein
MSLHILFVVLLVLWTDYQLNFREFFEQQCPLIKVTNKNFDGLTSHSSVSFLGKHEVQKKLVQLILVIVLFGFPCLLTLVLHISTPFFVLIFLNQLIMVASFAAFLTTIHSFNRVSLVIDLQLTFLLNLLLLPQ